MRPEVVGSRKLPMYTRGGSPYRLVWVSTAPVLASPKTSLRVRSSLIHLSPTDRGGEMNAWRTNPKGRLQGGYICLGSWLMGRLSLRLLVSRAIKENLFFRKKMLRKRAGGAITYSQGARAFPLYASVSGAEWWLHFKAESRSGEKNLKSNEERDQPAENCNKCTELDWPSIFDLP